MLCSRNLAQAMPFELSSLFLVARPIAFPSVIRLNAIFLDFDLPRHTNAHGPLLKSAASNEKTMPAPTRHTARFWDGERPPPSATRTAPVTKDASSDAKKRQQA